MIGLVAGCAPSPHAPSESERIVRAVLLQLTADGRPICLDDHTKDNALQVFREMTLAPAPSRWELRWYPPAPLRPESRITARVLKQTELDGDSLRIDEPGARRDFLPALTQMALTGAARRMMTPVGSMEEPVSIRGAWVPPHVAARWWLANRARRDCWPLFVVSDPVRDRRIAFVTVRAEHWGVLYALERGPEGWRTTAEWSRWLY